MNILYGIQGTGNGHISRARMMAKYFNQSDANMTYVFSGREPEGYFDMEVFGDYKTYRGLSFETQAGKIDHLKTIKNNGLLTFIKDVKQLDVSQYDLILTDFEPITAWAGKLKSKRVLGVGHQYAFGLGTPKSGYNTMAHFIMSYFAPAHYSVGLHWHPYSDNIVPPIVDTKLSREPNDDTHILVYLPFEDQTVVTEMLNSFSGFRFIQYSPDIPVDSEQGNVSLRKTCLHGFKHDLKTARAVLSNSGFELVSECIHMGLPVLVKPIDGQFEQQSNALALSQLKLGESMLQLDESTIKRWLASLGTICANPFPDVAQSIVNWILSGETDVKKLSSNAWAHN